MVGNGEEGSTGVGGGDAGGWKGVTGRRGSIAPEVDQFG